MTGIEIRFIPHEEQRYNTVGDWWEKDGVLHIRISALPRVGSMIAVTVHEIVEWFLCTIAGVDEKEVDDFDHEFTLANPSEEPGDDPKAPYQLQHSFATACERIIVAAAGINWKEHEDDMEILMHEYRHRRSIKSN